MKRTEIDETSIAYLLGVDDKSERRNERRLRRKLKGKKV